MSKRVTLLLIVTLAASSLIVSKFDCASAAITKPAVPEFTLKFVDHSYDVPPTYSFDPYTGKNAIIQAGYHVQNKSIEVTIKNQPFTNYKDANGTVIMLHYDIRSKGHFGDYWSSFNSTDQLCLVASSSLMVDNVSAYPNSPATVLSYDLGGNNGSDYYSVRLDISAGGQVDFQVQALIGYYTKIIHPPSPADQFSGGQPSYHYVFTGEASDWSNMQTITIPASASSTTIQLLAIIGTTTAVVVVAGLLVYFKKRKSGALSPIPSRMAVAFKFIPIIHKALLPPRIIFRAERWS